MSQTKVAITIEEGVLARVDALVRRKVFSNRSRAIQEAEIEAHQRLASDKEHDESEHATELPPRRLRLSHGE